MHEAISKKKYLKDKKVSNPLICVPYYKKKSDLVLAKNSILIDNSMRNLREWENDGGIPIFFNKDNLDYDKSNRKNIKYQKTNNLELLYKLD